MATLVGPQLFPNPGFHQPAGGVMAAGMPVWTKEEMTGVSQRGRDELASRLVLSRRRAMLQCRSEFRQSGHLCSCAKLLPCICY